MERDEFARCVVDATDKMYRIAWTILHHDEDCRDAMQEAAMRAWAKRHTLRDARFFSTWLIRILINEAYVIRRKRRRNLSLPDASACVSNAPDEELSLALQRLPEQLRLPLVMHALEGMSYEEIGKVLHLPHSTIAGRIRRGKQQLRKELSV